MKKRKMLLLLVIMFLITGCSKKNLNDIEESNNTTDESYNPFEANTSSEEEEVSTETLGSIGHGLPDSKTNESVGKVITYQGGELQLDYWVVAEGIGKSCGFFIYIDGIPQPYKLDDTSVEYKYMHELKLEEGKETNIKFIFTPVTGKKGETLSITVVSIINPSFAPDMIETSSYGYAHGILEANYSMVFEQDSDGLSGLERMQEICLSDVKISSIILTNAEKEKYLSWGQSDNSSFDNHVYTKLYIDEEDMKIAASYNIDNKEKIHIRYEITGHPGLKYKNILYINHQPISSQEANYYETDLQKGFISVVEMDLDLTKLEEEGTFYIVSVPCNGNDFLEDVVSIRKSRSILLYDNKNSTNANVSKGTQEVSEKPELTDSSEEQVNNLIVNAEEIILENSEEKIEGAYYAGKDNLLILGDSLYLYNIKKKSIVAETERQPGLEDMEVQIVEDGFVIVGTTGEEKEENAYNFTTKKRETIVTYNMECTFYDEDLKKLDVLDIVKQMEIDVKSTSEVAVSTDGLKIACISEEGLYVYDREKGERTLIVDVTDNEDQESRIISFMDIAFVDNNQKIVFLSDNLNNTLVESQHSYSAYGIVKVDGSGLVSIQGKELAKLAVFNDVTLMSQDIALHGASGEAWVIDNKKQELMKHSLNEKSESENIWGSDAGQYFATSVRKKDEGWLIRIYDMVTGKKVYEKLYECEETDSFKEPYIRVFDQENKFFLFFRPMQEGIESELLMGEF